MHTKSIQKLIDLFAKFPTVGPRTASRFVFFLLQKSDEEINELMQSIQALKQNTKICPSCFNSFESENALCSICSSNIRDKSLLCVVANEIDLDSIEKTHKYKGVYFVLGGTVSALKKSDIEKLRIKELVEKISKLDSSASAAEISKLDSSASAAEISKLDSSASAAEISKLDSSASAAEFKNNPEIQEVILALNSTTEGESTILYLERTLKPLGKKLSRLGRGLPLGAELEYADEETLAGALEGRK